MTLDLEVKKIKGHFFACVRSERGVFFLHHFLEKLLKSIFNSLMLSFSKHKGSEMYL